MSEKRLSFEELKQYYEENSDFKDYIDKTCVKEEKTVDEALQLRLAEYTAQYYMKAPKKTCEECKEDYDAEAILEDKSC